MRVLWACAFSGTFRVGLVQFEAVGFQPGFGQIFFPQAGLGELDQLFQTVLRVMTHDLLELAQTGTTFLVYISGDTNAPVFLTVLIVSTGTGCLLRTRCYLVPRVVCLIPF